MLVHLHLLSTPCLHLPNSHFYIKNFWVLLIFSVILWLKINNNMAFYISHSLFPYIFRITFSPNIFLECVLFSICSLGWSPYE